MERNAKLNEARMTKRAALSPLASPETSNDPILPLNVPEVPDPSQSEYESEPEDDDFTDEKAQEILDNFIVALPLEDRRMLAVVLTENFIKRQKMRRCPGSWLHRRF